MRDREIGIRKQERESERERHCIFLSKQTLPSRRVINKGRLYIMHHMYVGLDLSLQQQYAHVIFVHLRITKPYVIFEILRKNLSYLEECSDIGRGKQIIMLNFYL